MLYIVNDTSIRIDKGAIASSQGGTSAYVTGFINYLLHNRIEFGLIGNFEINDQLKVNSHISHPATNLSFLKYLIKLFIVRKFDKEDVFYFQRPDHLACSFFLRGGKRILHLHGQPRTIIIENKNKITKFSYLLLERLAMHISALILVTDKKSASIYSSQYPFIQKKIKIVPTGIDLSFFSDTNEIPTPDKTELNKELIYIGRLAEPKQVHEMLMAFQLLTKSVKHCHFSIAGSGPLQTRLHQSVKEMGLEKYVSFTGIFSKIQIRELIFKCDAAILLSRNEGSPISIKEVLACGKPVIVNDVGDLTEYIIHGKNGYIVNVENSSEIAEAIALAFKNSKNMRGACINSMLLYNEAITNHATLNFISGSNLIL